MADDDEQWRYSVDDFPDDGPGETQPTETVAAEDDEADPEGESDGNVAGQIGGLDDDPEPGTPTLENTFFVLLGAAATVLFFLVVAGVI